MTRGTRHRMAGKSTIYGCARPRVITSVDELIDMVVVRNIM